MVRLKEVAKNCFLDCLNCFNSLMVRLKEGVPRSGTTNIPKFQFPNGSIKSKLNQEYTTLSILFQFPNGSIKRRVAEIYI